MSISVKLCHNSSPVEKIGKTIDAGTSYDCVLKAGTSVLTPTIILCDTGVNLKGYNYMYIADFGRYYFIDDIVTKNNDVWEVSGHVDVLETYKDQILANTAVIKRQEKQYNLYLDDPEFHTYNYEQIQTLKFPANAFDKTLSYVLVCNGE